MRLSRRNLLVAFGCAPVAATLLRISPAGAITPVFDIPEVDGRFERVVDAKAARQSIYALNIHLSDNLVPKDADLFVYAYSVFVGGTLRTNGRSLTIVARHVRAAEGALIDLKGLPASPDYEGRAARNGQAPGEKGDDGRNGANGPSAGHLTVVCDEFQGVVTVDATGRRGGGGESGGNGANGQAGANNPELGSRGGAGGRGGDAGKAGTPGRGGNGGNVTIRSVNEVKIEQIKTDLRRGLPGAAAQNGNRGGGGVGGWGASGRVCEDPCP